MENQEQLKTSQEAFMENMALINQIVSHMKEIPVLPSEQPKEVSVLLKVEFPEHGGVLTHMAGHDGFPYKGFPFYDFVDKIDYMKKLSRGFLSGLFHSLKTVGKWRFITLLPALWVSRHFFRAGVYSFYRMVERVRIKPIRYCDAVRELHRAFSYEDSQETEKNREFRFIVRDLVCMVLEFDNAYRFRFQDIMEDLNQDAMKQKPINEIIRLFDIMSQREKHEDIQNTWVLTRLFVKYYLRFDSTLTRILKNALSRIELSKVFLSKEDMHYCETRQDYTFKYYGRNGILS